MDGTRRQAELAMLLQSITMHGASLLLVCLDAASLLKPVLLPAVLLQASAAGRDISGREGIDVPPDGGISVQADPHWRGAGRAHVVAGVFGASGARRHRATPVLVSDGADAWSAYSRRLHRGTLVGCEAWAPLSAIPGGRANSFKCAAPSVSRAGGVWAAGLLNLFQRAPALAEAAARLYGVEVGGCSFGEDGHGLNVIVQNSTMHPDSFHPDLCEAPDGWARRWRGLTLLTYPHDAWETGWAGHLQLAGPRGRPVVRLAPLPNRSVLLDACIWHRATNPDHVAAPLRAGLAPSVALRRLLGIGRAKSSFRFRSWRFAVAMQMRCPPLRRGAVGGQ
uniref:Prolyl 4-hydroxylase alpha subunit Fe(2+) 2OG dioxygenase domain-containing protein n=1 Tax=Alexandrium monilatum TaxID=311494 RepID=A0A7S4W4R7_9DINO|mmetsp:Transcript_76936/g.243115  ORF Transcript_76936/g.243115 Transcript_76936/m.243115 type:complete len:336 (-) Transcript_76936:88-1095(-)